MAQLGKSSWQAQRPEFRSLAPTEKPHMVDGMCLCSSTGWSRGHDGQNLAFVGSQLTYLVSIRFSERPCSKSEQNKR